MAKRTTREKPPLGLALGGYLIAAGFAVTAYACVQDRLHQRAEDRYGEAKPVVLVMKHESSRNGLKRKEPRIADLIETVEREGRARPQGNAGKLRYEGRQLRYEGRQPDLLSCGDDPFCIDIEMRQAGYTWEKKRGWRRL